MLAVVVALLFFVAPSTVRALPPHSLVFRSAAVASNSNSPRLIVAGGWNEAGTHQDVDTFDLTDGSADKATPMPTPRRGHAAVTLDGAVYVVGGTSGSIVGEEYLSTVDVYLPAPIDDWFPTTPLSTARFGVAACVFEKKIYAIGGSNGSHVHANGEVFDPMTKRWTPIAPMATQRYKHGCGVLRGQIYVVGGDVGGAMYIGSVEKYSPKIDRWSPVQALEHHRRWLSVVVVHQKLYAIGGMDADDVCLKSVERYDPDFGEWSRAPDMPAGLCWAGATSIGDVVYVAGGSKCGKYTTAPLLDSVVTFDANMNVWNANTNMRLSVPRHEVACSVVETAGSV